MSVTIPKIDKNMMRSDPRPRIFLSSTFLDLADTRKEISRWLSEIFGADLIVMESFGSDTAAPDIHSVRKVREADIFVGIYAHRYGTIDPTTGKSITELELDEAKHGFSTGSIRDILLYTIDESAQWPDDYVQKDKEAQLGLQRLIEKARDHTITYFDSTSNLPFYIIRDIHKRIEYFGITPPKIRSQVLPKKRHISRPLGLEFISSVDREYLIGREREIEELVRRLDSDPFVLLLSDSGVGKTSLIHAGLIPYFISSEWRCIYTRPFGLPCADIVNQIQADVFKRRQPYYGPLAPLLAEVLAALDNQKTLLIIDQFEDVLIAREPREVEELVSGLCTLREFHNPTLRVLVSYRADHEGRLGVYWQSISGSARGLPRVYLGGLSEKKVWGGIDRATRDLSIKTSLKDDEVNQLMKDLIEASSGIGVSDAYPPYVQMLVDHMWSRSKEKKDGSYGYEDYREAGEARDIIGGYLSRQLAYAKDMKGYIRLVLISLVRSYGVRAQKKIDEIVEEVKMDWSECETALERLIDLRLVRHMGEGTYEISHDFIAQKIIEEFVDPEEREFKRFRELLTSKAAAYQTTFSTHTAQSRKEGHILKIKY